MTTVALDASTPAFVTGTSNPAVTASFTPPARSMLIAFAEADESNTFSLSNTGGLSFTSIDSLSAAGVNSLGSWWAYTKTAPGSMTVSATRTGSFNACALKLLVFTGTETTFTGAHSVAQSNTTTLVGTRTGSWGWAAIGDNLGATTDAAGTGCTYNDAEVAFGGVSGGILKRTAIDGIAGGNMTLAAGSAPGSMSIIAVEIKPYLPPPLYLSQAVTRAATR